MFQVFYSNFSYGPEERFATLKDAVACGKKCGFEFTVHDAEGIVLSGSPLFGVREYRAIGKDGELVK